MNKEIYHQILSLREKGIVFSKIKKDLSITKKYDEQYIIKAIGKIHDHEAEIKKYDHIKKSNLSLAIGSSLILLFSLGYTLYTFFNESSSFFLLLYGPIFGGLAGTAVFFEKYRGAKNHLLLLHSKFT